MHASVEARFNLPAFTPRLTVLASVTPFISFVMIIQSVFHTLRVIDHCYLSSQRHASALVISMHHIFHFLVILNVVILNVVILTDVFKISFLVILNVSPNC